MTGNQYLTGLTLYFLGYVLFELPCNIVLKRTTPRFWLPTLTIAWGIVATLMGVTQNLAGFFVVRFLYVLPSAQIYVIDLSQPWCNRIWPLSRCWYVAVPRIKVLALTTCSLLSLDVVQARRAPIQNFALLQRRFTCRGIWWYISMGHRTYAQRGRLLRLEMDLHSGKRILDHSSTS